MPIEDARKAAMKLYAHLETLAALGAALALSFGNRRADPEISTRINNVVAAIDENLLSDISGDEAEILYSFIRSYVRQALDLIENPDRSAEWSFDDPTILQEQGKGSRQLGKIMSEFAASKPALSKRLSKPGKFLDVGSGTGWLSMDVATRWPALHVDGIDVFKPSLKLASQNLATSEVADRVTFYEADFAKLEAVETYSAAFVAAPFIPRDIVDKGITALYRALEPEGWVFMVILGAAPDQLSQALLDLQVARRGGAWMDSRQRSSTSGR